ARRADRARGGHLLGRRRWGGRPRPAPAPGGAGAVPARQGRSGDRGPEGPAARRRRRDGRTRRARRRPDRAARGGVRRLRRRRVRRSGRQPRVPGGSVLSGKVGVGIIGAGVISSQYLTNLTTFADVEVLFIADLDTDRARERAEEFGVPGHGTVEQLLATAEVEIVVNLTVPSAHVAVGETIIAAGKHVWSEKPLALDRSGGQALLKAAESAGVRVACAPDTMLGASFQTALRT